MPVAAQALVETRLGAKRELLSARRRAERTGRDAIERIADAQTIMSAAQSISRKMRSAATEVAEAVQNLQVQVRAEWPAEGGQLDARLGKESAVRAEELARLVEEEAGRAWRSRTLEGSRECLDKCR